MHTFKMPSLFIKLNIHKAFDTINQSYLSKVLQVLGFGPCWREWVYTLFRTTSSCAILNGQKGPSFSYARGIGQGTPLSAALYLGHGPSSMPARHGDSAGDPNPPASGGS